ncbi:prolyl oligopeptidase family serine peptidase [bacterium]|nr:prolyl oligopeptidase family serine peptidase [bacterium]
MIARYFVARTHELADRCLADVQTLDDWNAKKDEWRRQLFEMLGLDPFPEKTPLNAEVTGTADHGEFVVERVEFQSRPGLYVTGNLYVPKQRDQKLPAILYVCGHGRVKKGDISYGNKAHYQHHGGWFARNGYVCLIIDTLQLGEIEGIHHGTYNHNRWWWNSRGYTSAGVEAWNCIRALDYLQSREEVDGERLGVTGRSGGGAYSWWIAALDERIKAAVPVAGITNLKNHVIDGCVEGHCDCMFMVNTYRWDYPQVAALVAPRPLLISNTDKDRIFPLDGVVDVYSKVRRIYELHGKLDHVGLQITEGPHKDTQELRIHAFHWFNKFLKGEDPLIETAAVKFFEPEELRVFSELPTDELNTTIDESFVPAAALPAAEDVSLSEESIAAYRQMLREKCFRGWPADAPSDLQLNVKRKFDAEHDGVHLSAFSLMPEPEIELTLYVLRSSETTPEQLRMTVLNVLDDSGWSDFLKTIRAGFLNNFRDEVTTEVDVEAWKRVAGMLKSQPWGMAWLFPRGIGPTAWNQSERKQTQHRRRFMLLGQTQDGMRVWDVCAGVQALRLIDDAQDTPVWLQSNGPMAGVCLYAALFEGSAVERLDLYNLPASHRDGPTFLNVLRFADVPLTVAHVLPTSRVVLYETDSAAWQFPQSIADRKQTLKKQFQIR